MLKNAKQGKRDRVDRSGVGREKLSGTITSPVALAVRTCHRGRRGGALRALCTPCGCDGVAARVKRAGVATSAARSVVCARAAVGPTGRNGAALSPRPALAAIALGAARSAEESRAFRKPRRPKIATRRPPATD
ncbi:unnamed protein product, partial [Iphiclides podalirius]